MRSRGVFDVMSADRRFEAGLWFALGLSVVALAILCGMLVGDAVRSSIFW